MIDIIIDNNYFTIEGNLPKFVEYRLRKVCSWCDPLDFGTVERYYHSKTGYTSFIPTVTEILTENSIKYRILDVTELTDKTFEAQFTKEFRIGQEELVSAALKHRICMLEATPGYGKTVAFAAIVANIGKRALILTEDSKPFNDAVSTIKNFTTIKEVGELRGSDDLDFKEVNVALVQKLYSQYKKGNKELLEFLASVKVLIVDECHHSVSESYASLIYEMFENLEYRIGVSATTLDREDGTQKRTKALLGDVVYKITYAQAIDNKVCVPAKVYYKDIIYPDGLISETARYTTIVKKCVTENAHRNSVYADMAKHFERQGLTCAIIVDQVKHAYILQKLIPGSAVVLGPDPQTDEEREALWTKLNNHEITCVISTLLDEAANIPSLGAVLIASNQKTHIKTIQRLRCTRSFSGEVTGGKMHKKFGYVFVTQDFAPHLKEHSTKKLGILKEYMAQHEHNGFEKLELNEYPEVESGKGWV